MRKYNKFYPYVLKFKKYLKNYSTIVEEALPMSSKSLCLAWVKSVAENNNLDYSLLEYSIIPNPYYSKLEVEYRVPTPRLS